MRHFQEVLPPPAVRMGVVSIQLSPGTMQKSQTLPARGRGIFPRTGVGRSTLRYNQQAEFRMG